MLKASVEWEHDDDQAVWDRGIARVIVVMVSTISLFYKYLLAFLRLILEHLLQQPRYA